MEGVMPKIGFEQVIGQRLAVSHLQNAVRTGRVSQAYLISGEKGAGKMKLALAFAAALLCAQPAGALRRMPFLRADSGGKSSGCRSPDQ